MGHCGSKNSDAKSHAETVKTVQPAPSTAAAATATRAASTETPVSKEVTPVPKEVTPVPEEVTPVLKEVQSTVEGGTENKMCSGEKNLGTNLSTSQETSQPADSNQVKSWQDLVDDVHRQQSGNRAAK